MYVSKIQNRITFKVKRGYYLEILTPVSGKLIKITKETISKDKNDPNY